MKIKKKKSGVDKTAAFVDSLDWQSMWEEYANSFNGNGTRKYATVWSYITKYTKVTKDREILYWLIGPKVVLEKGQKPKYSLDQYDWEAKRQQGFWYSSENIEQLKNDVHHKASAYEAVKQAGKVNVDVIAMLNNLLKRLEEEFGGRLLLPDLTIKENTLRAQLYMTLVKQITDISNSAQLMYARSQGLDLERLDQFYSLFGSAMGKTASALMGNRAESETSDNKIQAQFAKVVQMVTNKATEYNLPLPDNLSDAIKEVSAESVKTKKAKVN